MIRKLAVLVGTAALLLTAPPALAADLTRPFSFEYQTVSPADATGTCDAYEVPTSLRLAEVGSTVEGIGSHIGRFVGTVNFCVYFDLALGGPKSIGTGDLTAANGDQLVLTFDAVINEVGDALAVVIDTDGTGRFENALVELEGIGYANGDGAGSGTITYDASDRSPGDR